MKKLVCHCGAVENSFMILDEAQNSTDKQMKMFLTRLGIGSKAVITGDITQVDLKKNKYSGLIQAINILKGIDERRIPKNLDQKGERNEPAFNFTYSYGGQFHMDFPGLKDKILLARWVLYLILCQ